MEKKLKIIIGVLAAVILVLAGVLIAQLNKKTEIKEVVMEVTSSKDSLTNALALLRSRRQRLPTLPSSANMRRNLEL